MLEWNGGWSRRLIHMHICQHLQIAAWLHSPIDYAFIFNALHILWINSAMSIGTFDGCWPLFFWSDYSSRILFHIVLGHEMINNCICWRKTWISWIKYYNSKVGLVDSFHWQLAAWLHQLLMNSHSPAGQYYNLNPVNFRMSLLEIKVISGFTTHIHTYISIW